MEQQFDIILLPDTTGEKYRKIHLVKTMDELYIISLGHAVASSEDIIPQHLYVISDEEILDGDWCLYGDRVLQACGDVVPFANSHSKKIIASTDERLAVKLLDEKFVNDYVRFSHEKGYLINKVTLENYFGCTSCGRSELNIDNCQSKNRCRLNIFTDIHPVYPKEDAVKFTTKELIVIPASIVKVLKSSKDSASINDAIEMLEMNNKPLQGFLEELLGDVSEDLKNKEFEI